MVDQNLRRLGITGRGYCAPLKRPVPRPPVERAPAKTLTAAQVEEMINMYEKRIRQADIAQKLGVSQSAVSKRLRQLRMRTNRYAPRPSVNTELVMRMVELSQLGHSQSQIAKLLGCSQPSVCNHLPKALQAMREVEGKAA